jgi:hypothetical protein
MIYSQSINNVFLHIPRTGGSSIWHSLVAAHDRIQCLVFDIFHTAVADFGASSRVREALESVAAASAPAGRRLYHHHTPDDIRHWLPPAKELKVATVLRDPVERLVSYLVHLRAHLGDGALPSGMKEEILASWTAPFRAAMLDLTTSIDDLATIAAQEPAFRNYYVAYLSAFLLGHKASLEEPHPPITVALVDSLVEAGRRCFCTIGRFENLPEAYRQIASAFEIGGEIKHHINKAAERPKLSASTERELRREFFADYELMYRLTSN